MMMWLVHRIGILFDEKLFGNVFSQFGFDDIFHGELGQLTLGAHASEGNDDFITFDVDQLDISAMRPKSRADLFVDCLLDELHLLDIRQFP